MGLTKKLPSNKEVTVSLPKSNGKGLISYYNFYGFDSVVLEKHLTKIAEQKLGCAVSIECIQDNNGHMMWEYCLS